jgi:glutamyl-tRNA synthetase
MDMRITHVIRGDDHLNNTPRQMNMLRALGYQPPVYAHLPMILGPDGTKLSKRHGAVSVLQYRDDGFLPEAVLNYLVRLGWSHGDQEFFSIEEMVRLFDIAEVNKSASIFDVNKLTWLNQQHMMRALPSRIAPVLRWHLERDGIRVDDDERLEQIVAIQRERTKTVREMATNSAFFFRPPQEYDEKAVRKHVTAEILPLFDVTRQKLERLADWTAPAIHQLINDLAAAKQIALGKLAQPLRLALCGGTVSPPIDATLVVLGKDESLARLATASARWAAQPGHHS